MFCEVCGETIVGPPNQVIIGSASLIVCSRCVRFGVPIVSKSKTRSSATVSKPLLSLRKTSDEKPLEVVSDFNIKIRKAREELGLTQEVLSKYVREKTSTIKRIEAGRLKPTITLATKLEKVLKVSLVEKVVENTYAPTKKGEVF